MKAPLPSRSRRHKKDYTYIFNVARQRLQGLPPGLIYDEFGVTDWPAHKPLTAHQRQAGVRTRALFAVLSGAAR